MAGISSYGAYIPLHRLPRTLMAAAWGSPPQAGEKAVRNFDEDSITMATAAAIDCLKGTDRSTVDGVYFATTTAPYTERQGSTIIAAALDLRGDVRTMDFTNSLRCGLDAVEAAMDAINSGAANSILVAVADTRLGAAQGELEQSFGDGGAALLLGKDNVIATMEGSYTLTFPIMDRWRAEGDTFVRAWEDRWTIDEGYNKILPQAVAGVLKKLNMEAKDLAKAAYYAPSARRHGALARKLKLEEGQIQDCLFTTVGDTGAALAMMILVAALEEAKAGDKILCAGYGNGASAFVVQVTDAIEKAKDRRGIKRHLESKRPLPSFAKYQRWRGLVALEAAARPEQAPTSLSALWRERQTALPLYGGICKACGTQQFPLQRVCIICKAKDQQDPVRLSDKTATVFTFTHDNLAASADPPMTITVVDFDGGGRGYFNMTDREPDEVQVGMTVEMTFRKLYYDAPRGVHNYYWKTSPIRC